MATVHTGFPDTGVTYDGRIVKRGVFMNGEAGLGGYLVVNLLGREFSVHRIVAETLVFNPCPSKFNVVHHKNNDIYDNRARNLQWCTSSEQHHADKLERLLLRQALPEVVCKVLGARGEAPSGVV